MDMWNDDWWVITEMLTVKDGEVTHDGWLMVDGLWHVALKQMLPDLLRTITTRNRDAYQQTSRMGWGFRVFFMAQLDTGKRLFFLETSVFSLGESFLVSRAFSISFS